MALKVDGTVVSWGDPHYVDVSLTVSAGLSGVTSIAASFYQSNAIKGDGSIVSWGENGVPEQIKVPVPASVPGVIAISSGPIHTLALVLPTLPVYTADSPPVTVQAGVAVDYIFTASGNPAPTFAVSAGALPTGLSLSAAGVLSGTSTVAGSSTFTVSAGNGILPKAISGSHTIGVTTGPIYSTKVALQSNKPAVSRATYRATNGTPLRLAATGFDRWGNALAHQGAIFTTDHTVGIRADDVRGNSISFYTAGVHFVTATIGKVSTTVSVSVVRKRP